MCIHNWSFAVGFFFLKESTLYKYSLNQTWYVIQNIFRHPRENVFCFFQKQQTEDWKEFPLGINRSFIKELKAFLSGNNTFWNEHQKAPAPSLHLNDRSKHSFCYQCMKPIFKANKSLAFAKGWMENVIFKSTFSPAAHHTDRVESSQNEML